MTTTEALPFLRPLKNYRISSAKKVLSMTHGLTSHSEVTKDFKIRTVHSSQSTRRSNSKIQRIYRHEQLSIVDLKKGYRVQQPSRRPTRINPRLNNKLKNAPLMPQKSNDADKPQTEIPVSELRLGSEMKKGTVSKITSAFWESKRRFVVTKHYHQSFNDDEVRRDYQLMKGLSHTNLVSCLGLTTIDNRKTIVLELSDGGSLLDLMRDYGPFNETLIRKYLRQIVEALIYLKSKGIVHLRLCCQNILSDLNGNIKMCLPRNNAGNLLQENDYVYWQPPQVVLDGQINDKSGIWNLGCTLIEMSTGRKPWSEEGTCLISLKRNLAEGQTPRLPSHVSREFRELITNCLKSKPQDRMSLERLKELSFLKKL